MFDSLDEQMKHDEQETKGKPSQRGTFGLAPMYQTYLWSVWNAPGHHGYERAFD